MVWDNVSVRFIDLISDIGMIALALLAKDRYLAVSDPIEYMVADLSIGRRSKLNVGAACALVIGTIATYTSANVLVNYGKVTDRTALWIQMMTSMVRTIYLFISLVV